MMKDEPKIRYYTPKVRGKALRDKAGIITYIAFCCQEWVMAYTYPPNAGRCGKCGEVPTYLREDDYECVPQLIEDPEDLQELPFHGDSWEWLGHDR